MDETLTLNVEATSDKYGPSFCALVNGTKTWLRPSKFDAEAVGPVMSRLSKGDVVEAIVSGGKYVKSLNLSAGHAVPTPSGEAKAFVGGSVGNNKDPQIARATSVKAVLQSPMLSLQWKDLSAEEAVTKAKDLILSFEKYILTGGF